MTTYQERPSKGGGWECAIVASSGVEWRKLLPCKFTAENAAKVHARTKTQTRRLVRGEYRGVNTPPTGWEYPRWPVGTVLWIQEPWRVAKRYDDTKPTELPDFVPIDHGGTDAGGKLRPAMFLPLRFARTERYFVTDVRVDRVNEISEADARAEGCDGNCPVGYIPAHQAGPCRYHFAQLWDSIHSAPGATWRDNPWVWVYTFKKIT